MKTCLLLSLAGLLLLCGCGKQTQTDAEKIEALSRKTVQLQYSQARQLQALAPALAQTNSYYFAKSYDNALFFHTNTLYLLLAVSKNIQEQLRAAEADRAADNLQLRQNQTNLADRIFFCTAQITTALADCEKRMQENLNAETRRVGASLGQSLTNQIRSLAPDKAELARRIKLEADVAQIQRDLDAIKARLGITNPPAARP